MGFVVVPVSLSITLCYCAMLTEEQEEEEVKERISTKRFLPFSVSFLKYSNGSYKWP